MDQDLLQLSRSPDEFGEVASEFILQPPNPHPHPSPNSIEVDRRWGDHNNHNTFKYKYSDREILDFDFIFLASQDALEVMRVTY